MAFTIRVGGTQHWAGKARSPSNEKSPKRALGAAQIRDRSKVNDHLPSALSGDAEGVAYGFALGEEFKAAKAKGQIANEAGS